MKRRIREPGAFFKIPLEGSKDAYARLIGKGLFSFYNIDSAGKTGEEIIKVIANASPIFSVYIHKDLFSKSQWQIIGHKPLEEHILNSMPFFFAQDLADPKKCTLLSATDPDYEKSVTPQECVNLERAMVWEFETVEERLKDYIENRPNRIVEEYKVKL